MRDSWIGNRGLSGVQALGSGPPNLVRSFLR
jgi:hypothetical protein